MSINIRLLSLSATFGLSLVSMPAQAGVISDWGAMATMLMNNAGLNCGQVSNVIEARDGNLECSLTPAQRSYTNIAQCLPALAANCEEIETDEDGDGYSVSDGDTDDNNALVYPGAEELCDGIQNDSDDTSWRASDEDDIATYFVYDGSHFDASTMTGEFEAHLPGELQICSGEWHVNIVVTANGLTIRGMGERETTLDGAGRGSVISADGIRGLVIEDITLTGGDADYGGGIYLSEADAELSRVTLDTNDATDGGGIYMYDSDLLIEDSTLTDNYASSDGGAIHLYYDAEVTLIDSEVSDNYARGDGGGLYVDHSASNGENVDFIDNDPDDVYKAYSGTSYTLGLSADFSY